jgi:hypothetical protein
MLFPSPSHPAGSDCASSIALDNRRALWIWGDTLYGHVTPNKERLWSAMPHNAIGLLDLDSPDGFTHYITLENDALFYPEKGGSQRDALGHEGQAAEEYYWVLQGTGERRKTSLFRFVSVRFVSFCLFRFGSYRLSCFVTRRDIH